MSMALTCLFYTKYETLTINILYKDKFIYHLNIDQISQQL